MAKRRYPTDILEQMQVMLQAWKQINPNLKIGTFSPDDLETISQRSRQISVEIDTIEIRLTELRNQRDQELDRGWEMLKRLRATIKGLYGDDSSQYEMIGGTRMSERKTRKKNSSTDTPSSS